MREWLYRHRWSMMIAVVTLAMRLWAWGSNPPALYWEEVALAYDSWSIATTGRDYHGQAWPLLAFNSFGDYKPSGYFYVTALLMKIFGPRDFVVRLPSLLAGFFIVWACGRLAGKIDDRHSWHGIRLCHVAAFLAAVNPALVQVSRAGFECNLAVAFLLAGVLLLWPERERLLFADDKISWRTVGGTVMLWLAFYTYHAMRVVAPFVGVYLLGWQLVIAIPSRRWLKVATWRTRLGMVKTLGVVSLVCVVACCPVIDGWRRGELTARMAETTSAADVSPIAQSNQCRQIAHDSAVSKILCHRYFFQSRSIFSNLMSHFNFDYLFVTGDANRRHSIGLFGVFYPWDAIGLLAGVYVIAVGRRRYRGEIGLACWWAFLSLLPASLTTGVPHLLRTLSIVPLMILVASLGWWGIIVSVQRRWRRLLVMLIVLLYSSGAVAWQVYAQTYYRVAFADQWQYGYKQAIAALSVLEERYPDLSVYLTRVLGRPSIYYFWEKRIPPAQVQAGVEAATFEQGEFRRWRRVEFGTGLVPHEQLLMLTPAEADGVFLEDQVEIYNLKNEPVLIVGREVLRQATQEGVTADD